MTTYPNGYGSTLLTLEHLEARHGPKMHPEFRRRFFALVRAGEGIIGIGGGWRSTEEQAASYARDPKGFAPPGSSFHEFQTFASGIVGYQAIDTVGRDGRHAEAWAWLRANEARFGLRSFWNVNNEPWHVQCVDIPLSVSQWKNAGRPDPTPTFVLPGDTVTPPEAQPPPIVEEDDMAIEVIQVDGDVAQYERHGILARWAETGPEKQAHAAALGFSPTPRTVPRGYLKNLTLVGPQPQGAGVITSYKDFGGHVA